jgi:hypothetical protein
MPKRSFRIDVHGAGGVIVLAVVIVLAGGSWAPSSA